jgi:hypothetical protein
MDKNQFNYIDKKTFELLSGRKWRNLQEGDELVHACFNGLDPSLHKYALVTGENFKTKYKEGGVEFESGDIMFEPDDQRELEQHGALLCCSPDFLDSLLLTEEIENVEQWVSSAQLNGGILFLVKSKGSPEL